LEESSEIDSESEGESDYDSVDDMYAIENSNYSDEGSEYISYEESEQIRENGSSEIGEEY